MSLIINELTKCLTLTHMPSPPPLCPRVPLGRWFVGTVVVRQAPAAEAVHGVGGDGLAQFLKRVVPGPDNA